MQRHGEEVGFGLRRFPLQLFQLQVLRSPYGYTLLNDPLAFGQDHGGLRMVPEELQPPFFLSLHALEEREQAVRELFDKSY